MFTFLGSRLFAWTLSTKVIASALVAASVIMISIVAFYSYRLTDINSATIQARAQQVATLQANALIQPIADYDIEGAQGLLESLTSDPDMSAARIFEVDGNIIAESGQWSNDPSEVIFTTRELIADGEKVGIYEQQVSLAGLIELEKEGVLLGVASILLAIFALFIVLKLSLRQFTVPLDAMTEVMGILANGDSSVYVPNIGTENEIGKIADAVQVFKDNAIQVKRLGEEQAETERRAETEKRKSMNDLANSFEKSVGRVVQNLSEASSSMRQSAENMVKTADQTSQQSSAVASVSEEAAINVQTVASATEELSSSITEISRQVSHSTAIAGQAVERAEKTQEMIEGLVRSANKIGEVVNLITDIAEQTNLLALNATIEAARAGDAGKGFAVVANEVKSLASQTARATEEIGSQINGVQSATKDAAGAVKNIGNIIDEISNISTSIATAVEEQQTSTAEIANNVQQVSAGTQEVTSNIATVSSGARETGEAATNIANSAGNLEKESDALKSEVEIFLSKVRSA